MVDSIKKYANVDFNEIPDEETAKALAKEHNIKYEDHHKRGNIIELFFDKYVEEHLVQPTFITDYPVDISPLASKSQKIRNIQRDLNCLLQDVR